MHCIRKKAQMDVDPLKIIVGVVLLLITAFVVIMIFRGGAQKGEETLFTYIDSTTDASCKQSGELKKLQGIDFIDVDADSRPDILCDTCLGGNNDNDKDSDGIPDACDVNPEHADEYFSESTCKGFWKRNALGEGNHQCVADP